MTSIWESLILSAGWSDRILGKVLIVCVCVCVCVREREREREREGERERESACVYAHVPLSGGDFAVSGGCV